jgi:uncharacterized repeat protein (TIGR03803 family)
MQCIAVPRPGPFAAALALAALIAAASAVDAAPHESVAYAFRGAPDGAFPQAGLIADATGALYGTTTQGGTATATCGGGCGTVFKLTPTGAGYKETILYSFQGGIDGASPQGDLLELHGALYGTTLYGGTQGLGTVFKLAPAGSGYREDFVLSFAGGFSGALPRGGRLIANRDDTALFGTTYEPTYLADGSIFEVLLPSAGFMPALETIVLLSPSMGRFPYGGLAIDPSGNLFGMAVKGGNTGGTVFELEPAPSGTYTANLVYAFGDHPNDGGYPYSGLIRDATGVLYGTTFLGGPQNKGTAIMLAPSGTTYAESVIYGFTGSRISGSFPFAGLAFGKGGTLYGTTLGGGTHGLGTAFALIPGHRVSKLYTEVLLHSFAGGRDGATPEADIVVSRTSTVFGTTYAGGRGFGTVFQISSLP